VSLLQAEGLVLLNVGLDTMEAIKPMGRRWRSSVGKVNDVVQHTLVKQCNKKRVAYEQYRIQSHA